MRTKCYYYELRYIYVFQNCKDESKKITKIWIFYCSQHIKKHEIQVYRCIYILILKCWIVSRSRSFPSTTSTGFGSQNSCQLPDEHNEYLEGVRTVKEKDEFLKSTLLQIQSYCIYSKCILN